jgi:hypothetical protein
MVFLCGNPKGGCCPEARLLPDGKNIEIEDDSGDTIEMTKEQFEILKKTEIKDL